MPGPMRAASAYIDIGMDVHPLKKDLDKTKRSFNKTLNSIQSRMKVFATNLTRMWHTSLLGFAAFTAAAGVAVNSFSELENAQTDLAKRMNVSRDAVQGIASDLTKLSMTMPTTRQELTEIAVSAAQVGVAGENIVKFVQVMKQFEIATGRAADEAVKDFKRIMNVTGESISNVENLGSELAKLVDQFPVADVETIMQVMIKMGRTMGAAMDVSSQELASLSVMVSSMAKRAARPASQMRKLFTEMATDTEKFAKIAGISMEKMTAAINEGPVQAVITLIEELREVPGSVQRFQELSDVSRTTAKAIAPLIEFLPSLKKALREGGIAFKENTELMEDYEKEMKNISTQLKISWGNLQTFTQTVGQALAPALRNLNKNVLKPFTSNLVMVVNNSEKARKAIADFILTGLKITGLATAVGALAKMFAFLLGPIGFAITTMLALWAAWELNIYGVKDALQGLAEVFDNMTSLEPVKAIKNFIDTATKEPIGTAISLGLTIQAVSMLAGGSFITAMLLGALKGLSSIAALEGGAGAGAIPTILLASVIPIALEMAIEGFTGKDVHGLGDYIDSFWKWVEEQIQEAVTNKSKTNILNQIMQKQMEGPSAKGPSFGEKALGISKFLAEHPFTTMISIGIGVRAVKYASAITQSILGMTLTSAVLNTVKGIVTSYGTYMTSTSIGVGISEIAKTTWAGAGSLSVLIWDKIWAFLATSLGVTGGLIAAGTIGFALLAEWTLEKVTGADSVPGALDKLMNDATNAVRKWAKKHASWAFSNGNLFYNIGGGIKWLWGTVTGIGGDAKDRLKELGLQNINMTGKIEKWVTTEPENLTSGSIEQMRKYLDTYKKSNLPEDAQKIYSVVQDQVNAYKKMDKISDSIKSKITGWKQGVDWLKDLKKRGGTLNSDQIKRLKNIVETLQNVSGDLPESAKDLLEASKELLKAAREGQKATGKKKGGPVGFQKGGMAGFVPGAGSGDIIPAMLEPGEFVWPKGMVNKFPGLIKGMWQGFEKGGSVSSGKHYYGSGPDNKTPSDPFRNTRENLNNAVDKFSKWLLSAAEDTKKANKVVGQLKGVVSAIFGTFDALDNQLEWTKNQVDKTTQQINKMKQEIGEAAATISEQVQKFREIDAVSAAFKKAGLDYDETSKKLDYLKGQLEEHVKQLVNNKQQRKELNTKVKKWKQNMDEALSANEDVRGATRTNASIIKETSSMYEKNKKALKSTVDTIGKEKSTIDELIKKIKELSNTFIFGVTETDKMAKAFQSLNSDNISNFASHLKDLVSSQKQEISQRKTLGMSYEEQQAQLDALKEKAKKLGIDWDRLIDATEGTQTPLDKLANKLGVASNKLSSWISSTISSLTSLIDQTGVLTDAQSELADGMVSVTQDLLQGNWVQAIIDGLTAIFASWITKLKKKRDELQKKLDATYSMINDSIRELGNAISSLAGSLLGPFDSALSGAIDGILNFAQMIQQGGGTVEGTKSAFQALLSITTGIISSFTNLLQRSSAWQQLQEEMKPIWDALANALGVLIQPLRALVDWVKDFLGISKAVNDELGKVSDLNVAEGFKRARTIWESSTPGQQPTSETDTGTAPIPQWAKTMIQPIKKALIPILNSMKGVNIGQSLKSIAQNIVTFVAKKIPQAWTWLQGVWDWLVNKAPSIWGTIKEKAKLIYDWFVNNFQDNFESALGNLKNWDPSKLEDKLAQVRNKIREVGNALIQVLATAAGAIVGAISGLTAGFGTASWGTAALGAGAGWLLSQMATVPKLQHGGTVVETGLAQVHKGEVYSGVNNSSLGGDVKLNADLYIDGHQLEARLENVRQEKKYSETGSTTGSGYGRS